MKQLLAVLVIAAWSTVARAQVTCQTLGNTTNCNGSLGGSTISDNGSFLSNLAKQSASQSGPNAVALQQQAAAQAQLANQQANLAAQQAEYVRIQTEELERQKEAENLRLQNEARQTQNDAETLRQQKLAAQQKKSPLDETAGEPVRCSAVRARCADESPLCATYKELLVRDGVACHGLSAPPAPPTHREAEGLAEIQASCDTTHKEFASQIACIKRGVRTSESMAKADSANIQLFLLTADQLVDDLARRQITVASARVDLQKAYLDFRDRTARSSVSQSN